MGLREREELLYLLDREGKIYAPAVLVLGVGRKVFLGISPRRPDFLDSLALELLIRLEEIRPKDLEVRIILPGEYASAPDGRILDLTYLPLAEYLQAERQKHDVPEN